MKQNIKRHFKIFLLVLITVLIFTFIDYLFHAISPEYSVPSWYFRNKIIFETVYVYVAYLLLRKVKPAIASFITAVVTSTLLQARYYFLGFNCEFVVLFWGIHLFILWPVLWLFFEYKDKIVK